MNGSTKLLQRRRIAIAIALTAGLAGCGGGGDGSTEPPNNLVTVSAANQDTVAHAGAAALGMIGVTNVMPLSATASMSHALAASGTKRPLTVYPPEVQYCVLGGSMSLTWDDRNGNRYIDVGDVITTDFNACANDASGTVNGRAVATITASGDMAMSMRMVMTDLSTTSASHTLTVDGAMAVDVTADAAGTTAAMRMTADGRLTVTAHTHGFDDTVTLQSGFVQNASFDATGTSRVIVSGRIESTAMSGAVDVSTLAELVNTATDAYPSAGTIRLTGKAGKLTLTAAGVSVRMDLDDDDDNETEATKSPTWDWLL